MAVLTLAQAITAGLDTVLERDDETLIFGEDVGKNGGVFRITDGLQAKYSEDRVFDTPLAESGILNMSIGLSTEGFRPIPEIQFAGFLLQGMDAVVGQFSRLRYRYGGTRNCPITVRTPFGGGVHTPELHSDNMEFLVSQVPGLRVVMPSSAYDAKGLLISAVENDDPVIFFEHLRMYRTVKDEVPDEYYTVPLDKAKVVKEGKDVSIITYGLMVHESLKATEALAKDGIDAEIVDLRTLAPFDTETIVASVEKTHHAVVVQEAQRNGGVGAMVASELAERAFMSLDAPIMRVAAPDTPFAFGAAEAAWMPNADDVAAKVRESVDF